MTFLTTCVNCPGPHAGDAINEMVEAAREITWRTFRKYVSPKALSRLPLLSSYHWGQGPAKKGAFGLRIQDDYAVSFHKSTFRGRPCVFLVHSSIEHIFV